MVDDPTADGPADRDPNDSERRTETGVEAPTANLPRNIGHFTIKERIASGGMGTVYKAVQEQPRRSVAIKVMKHGVTSRSALRRFEYEAQLLARLRHPYIAQVYEAGTHDDGSGPVPFFAMEYIPNAKPITKYAEDKKLGTRERLDLFARVCDAVHHGHQRGIIHRDLKPSNILVDSHGQPRIIDFGVARATDSDMARTTLQTDLGQLIGTLQYMSPEQCEARSGRHRYAQRRLCPRRRAVRPAGWRPSVRRQQRACTGGHASDPRRTDHETQRSRAGTAG